MERHIQIQTPLFVPAAALEEYFFHIAACEWSVINPIIIHNQSDLLSYGWKEKGLKPFEHQFRNLLYFFKKLPCALLADDVGLGKTISAGLILSELMVRKRVKNTLIVAPRILCKQWQGELEKSFGLYADCPENGNELLRLFNAAKSSTTAQSSNSIIITTYEMLRNKIGDFPDNYFQMGIFDEAHKLRNLYGSVTPPKIASRLRKKFQKKSFDFVLMLTATPVQNKLWDIYSLIDLLKTAEGEENPLGDKNSFQAEYLTDAKGLNLREESKEKFRSILQKTLCRTQRKETKLPFPKRTVMDDSFTLSPQEERLLDAQKRFFMEFNQNSLQQTLLAQALMSSPHAFLKQLKKCSEIADKQKASIPELERLVSEIPMTGKMKITL